MVTLLTGTGASLTPPLQPAPAPRDNTSPDRTPTRPSLLHTSSLPLLGAAGDGEGPYQANQEGDGCGSGDEDELGGFASPLQLEASPGTQMQWEEDGAALDSGMLWEPSLEDEDGDGAGFPSCPPALEQNSECPFWSRNVESYI